MIMVSLCITFTLSSRNLAVSSSVGWKVLIVLYDCKESHFYVVLSIRGVSYLLLGSPLVHFFVIQRAIVINVMQLAWYFVSLSSLCCSDKSCLGMYVICNDFFIVLGRVTRPSWLSVADINDPSYRFICFWSSTVGVRAEGKMAGVREGRVETRTSCSRCVGYWWILIGILFGLRNFYRR